MAKQYVDAEHFGQDFLDLVSGMISLRRQQAAVEEELRMMRLRIMGEMKAVSCDAVRGLGFRASIYERESRRVVPEKLVALGVDPELIRQATEISRYEVLDVREEK